MDTQQRGNTAASPHINVIRKVKKATVNATVEIDRAGRIVVPKKLRDALHLIPGTRLNLRQEGQCLVLEQERPRGRLNVPNTLRT